MLTKNRRKAKPNMKYIIFDLDDTLLNNQRQVSDYTLLVLRQLQQLEHRIVINTARSLDYSQAIFDRIRPDYAVVNGGALIVDRHGQALFRAQIDHKTTLAVLQALLEVTDNFSVQTEDALYSNNGSYTGQNARAFDFARDEFPFPALKIVASIEDDVRAESLARQFGLEYTTYLSGIFRRYNHPSATKALGNRNLVALTGGSMDDVLAFGDDLGDMEMLQQAGIGVLMKNAAPALHDCGCRISRYTNDEDGVARFLVDFFSLS